MESWTNNYNDTKSPISQIKETNSEWETSNDDWGDSIETTIQQTNYLENILSENDLPKDTLDYINTKISELSPDEIAIIESIKNTNEFKEILMYESKEWNIIKTLNNFIINNKESKNIQAVEVKNQAVEVKNQAVEVKNQAVEEKTQAVDNDKRWVEIYKPNDENFNKITDELSKAVDLSNPKYDKLKQSAESELLKSNPNLKAEVWDKQYESYVNALALMMWKETFIKDNPALQSQFKNLENEARTNPVFKEIQINNYFKENPEYTRQTKDTVKALTLQNSKKLDIIYSNSWANFIQENDKWQKETIQISKNWWIEKSISANWFSIKSEILFKPNYSLEAKKITLENKQETLSSNISNPDLKKLNLKSNKNIESFITQLENDKQNISGNLENMSNEKISQEETELKKELDELKNKSDNDSIKREIEIYERLDELQNIPKQKSDLENNSKNIENDIKILQELSLINTELSQITWEINTEKTNYQQLQENSEIDIKNRLEFLDNIWITNLNKDKFTNILKNTQIEPLKFIDFDKPWFGLEKTTLNKIEQQKIIIQVLNQSISWDKTKPIDYQNEKAQNWIITDDLRKEIILNLKTIEWWINYWKIENNLKKFNETTEETTTSEIPKENDNN